ncbi:MAG: hypothetical protein E6930_01135 [Cutibacterium avidum]|nr:hypothetical protein [Cutibacterium avidum]
MMVSVRALLLSWAQVIVPKRKRCLDEIDQTVLLVTARVDDW